MYELYNKDGSFKCYRMTRRIRNDDGEYDVITARSKVSERECKKVLEQKLKEYYLRREAEKGLKPNPDMTFADFADNWFEISIAPANISDRNKANYKNYVYTHLIPYFGKMKLCDIIEDDCQRFLNQYSGLSKAMVSHLRMTLRKIMYKAVKQKLIAENPADDIVLPKVYETERRPITDEERSMILDTAKTHYAGPMILTLLYCGLRPIEARNLKWADVDFDNNVLTVRKSKTKAGENRKLPIPPHLKAVLLKHKIKGQNNEYVFYESTHPERQLTATSFYSAWHNFCRQMDIEHGATVYRNQIKESVLADDLSPYLLRHTFATDCQAAGVPINVAKELMGHSDISVTAKIYTHMVDEVFEENRQRLTTYAEMKSQSFA